MQRNLEVERLKLMGVMESERSKVEERLEKVVVDMGARTAT